MTTTTHRTPSIWAFILIAVGAIWLLGEANILRSDHLAVLFRFWPLILIGFGVALLVGRNSSTLFTLIVLATLVLMLALMLVGPALGLAPSVEAQTAQHIEPLGDAESARVNINANVAELTVSPLEDSANLFEADVRYVGTLEFNATGTTEKSVTLRAEGSGGWFPSFFFFDWFGNDDPNALTWDVGVNATVPLDLNVTTGTGGGTLHLEDVMLSALDVNTGTGSIDLWLPSMDDSYNASIQTGTGGGTVRIEENAALTLSLQTGTGGMTIDIPEGAAVRLTGSVGTGGINVPANLRRISGEDDRFVGDSGTWETEDFGAADRQIVIDFNGGTGGLDVR
jgi:hypothetical protein